VPAVRILLVEDEAALLHLLVKYLQRLGYEVDASPTAAEALAKFAAAPENYDLAIADLGMPDMPGVQLLSRLVEIRPNLRILICSGSPFTVSSLPTPVQGQVAFLQKPFVPKMLSEALETLLAGK
jgi:CheY-like chemotaxis protein